MGVIRSVIEWGRKPTQTSRAWVLGVYIVGVLLVVVVGWNWRSDAQQFREAARRDSAAAVFQAQLAQYQIALAERTSCENRVESRLALRGAFSDVYGLIDELAPGNEFTEQARQALDRTYPVLVIDDCPPVPPQPTTPILEDM